MSSMILWMMLAAYGAGAGADDDVRTLIATIETLLDPIEDFRCEFEGTMYFKGKVAEREKVKADEPADSFSGLFIWKKTGEIRSESLHRRQPENAIMKETLVVRAREQKAEYYSRLSDALNGVASIQSLKEFNPSNASVLGQIFLVDELKRIATDENLVLSVSDDRVEGHRLKVLNIALKDVPGSLTSRYWIDLRRNGHVVRAEGYGPGKILTSRLDIKLEPFKVGDAEVWMPVSGESASYAALEGGKPIFTEEPTVLTTINVLRSTLEFNKHPGPAVFAIKYKPGTPVSDRLRKLTYEYGQQTIGRKPTRAEAKTMLDEQVAQAEAQKKELVAVPTEGVDWPSWLTWGFGGAVLVSLVALMIQRRRH